MTKIDISTIETFRSKFDMLMSDNRRAGYAAEQRAKGAELVKDGYTMTIGNSGVWGARKEGSNIQSYEKLGYHSCTEQLLLGYLQAGGVAVFYSFGGLNGEVSL